MNSQDYPARSEGMNSSNDGYTNAGAIQIRLDTGPMLDSIESFLRGTKIMGYRTDENGAMVPVFGKQGVPKANDIGIQSLMSWLTMLFSPHAVQGNYKDRDELNEYLCYVHKGLAKYVMANRLSWGISRAEYRGIVQGIMNIAEPFFSRLLENKERESYATTMRSMETNNYSPQQSGGLLSIFGRGGR